jgi:hypothetical protein
VEGYAHENRWRTMTLTAVEFLRRFVHHVLPRGFVRIRQFGYLASACRTARRARSAPPPTGSITTAVVLDTAGLALSTMRRTDVIGPILSRLQLATVTLGFDTS